MTNINVLAKALNGKVINNRIYLDCDLPAHEQQAYLDFDHGSASLYVFTTKSNRSPSWRLWASEHCKHRLLKLISEKSNINVTTGVAK